MKVTQHLWFEKDVEAAVRFYTSLIPSSSLGWVSVLPADTPSGPAGRVKLGQPLCRGRGKSGDDQAAA